MNVYIFATAAAAEAAQAAILVAAEARGDAGLPSPRTTRYALPQVHPTDGRAAIPCNAGDVPTETYRTTGAVAGLPEPVVLGEDWEPVDE